MMPLIIKIDVADDGRIYAWMKAATADKFPPSSLYAGSVPALLRKLARKIATGAK